MALLNIGSENANDAFYRYKMPRILAKVEGRGNGIKTNIVNNVDIAKALDRPPQYIVKFFGTELGAQTNYDDKSGTSIVNGSHTQQKLAEILEIFIKKYVQCYSCGNPETTITVKRDDIQMKCKACGAKSTIDITARFASYILKNPPPKREEKKKIKTKSDEVAQIQAEEARKQKAKAKAKGKKENSSHGQNGSDNENDKVKSDKKKTLSDNNQSRESTQTDVTIQQTQSQEIETDDGKQAPSPQSQIQVDTQPQLEEEQESDDPVENIRDMVANKNPPVLVADYLSNVSSLSTQVQKMKVLYQAIFADKDTKVSSQVSENCKYLKPFCSDQASQVAHLVALEHLLTIDKPLDDEAEITLIFMALFEEDILEENNIKLWYKKSNFSSKFGVNQDQGQQLRGLCTKFIEWLENAEEEESEED